MGGGKHSIYLTLPSGSELDSWIVSNVVKMNIFEIALLSLQCTYSQVKVFNAVFYSKED